MSLTFPLRGYTMPIYFTSETLNSSHISLICVNTCTYHAHNSDGKKKGKSLKHRDPIFHKFSFNSSPIFFLSLFIDLWITVRVKFMNAYELCHKFLIEPLREISVSTYDAMDRMYSNTTINLVGKELGMECAATYLWIL